VNGFKVNPGGNVPDMTTKKNGGVPDSSSGLDTAVPTVPVNVGGASIRGRQHRARRVVG